MGFKYLISCNADKASILDITKGFFLFYMIMIKMSNFWDILKNCHVFCRVFLCSKFAENLQNLPFSPRKAFSASFYFSFNVKIRKRFDKTAPTAASAPISSAAAAAVVDNLSYLLPALFFVFFRAALRSHFPLFYLFIHKRRERLQCLQPFNWMLHSLTDHPWLVLIWKWWL